MPKSVTYLITRIALLVAPLLFASESGCSPPGPEEACRYTSGTILKYDGTSWSAQSSGTTCQLSSVWGLDADNIWAVGLAGTVLKKDGAAWSVQPSGTTYLLRDVWGSDANNVWAIG